MKLDLVRKWLLVAAVSVVFLGFGVWELVNPQYWVSFLPSFLSGFAPLVLVRLHGIALVLVAAWLLSGWKLRIAAVFATLLMLEINTSLLIEYGFSDLLIRDVGILLAAAALMFENV